MRELWRRYLDLLDCDLNTCVFDNFKNLLACVLLFATGTHALHGEQRVFMGLFGSSLTG